MNFSEGLNSRCIDTSVGGLVWVRRRNGSWWPGRIMGMDEIDEASSKLPRAGTPVKLLGKDDASMDWYNLDKSKRIKAFHCGEFDDCIERAKAFAANSNRKAVKYARKEEAILHALELEGTHKSSQFLYHGLNACTGEKRDKVLKRSGARYMTRAGSKDDSISKELSQSVISFEQNRKVSNLARQEPKPVMEKTVSNSGDDGRKRLRGLPDLDVTISCEQQSGSNGSAGLHESVLSQDAIIKQNPGVSSHVRRRPSSTPKRTPSKEGSKRRNRRRKLSKVLKNSEKLVPYSSVDKQIIQGDAMSIDRGVESAELKQRCFSLILGDNVSTTSCKEEMTNISIHKREVIDGEDFGQSAHGGRFETGSNCLASQTNRPKKNRSRSCSKRKGKRRKKLFYLNTKSSECLESRNLPMKSKPCAFRAQDEEIGCGLLGGSTLRVGHDYSPLSVDDGPLAKCNLILEYSQLKLGTDKALLVEDLHKELKARFRKKAMTNKGLQILDILVGPPLFDVEVDVMNGCRGTHVPLISLTSGLDGKAIIGHPVPVAVINDDFCEESLYQAIDNKACGSEGALSRRLGARSSPKSAKKIRKLSSFSLVDSPDSVGKKLTADRWQSTSPTCISVKHVFDRLKESLGIFQSQVTRCQFEDAHFAVSG